MASILVVDDSKFQRSRIVSVLHERGHQTSECGSGKEALQILGNRSFDLVLTDLLMPEMTGQELIVAIRSSDKNTPIIVLTANIQKTEIATALESGANAVLQKPFEANHLIAEIAKHALSPGG